MGGKKRHHYVSRMYLRHFTDNPRQIFMFDKVTLAHSLVGMKDIAVAENFHTFPTEDIPVGMHHYLRAQFEDIARYETEEFLSKLEGLYSAVLRQLLSTLEAVTNPTFWIPHIKMDLDYRAVLAQFVIMSSVRTLEYRRRMRDLARSSWEAFVATGLVQTTTSVDEAFPDRLWPLIHALEMITPNRDELVENLLRKVWIIGSNNTQHPLYTSDNPVVRRPVMLNGTILSGYNAPGMEIAFPLSSKYLLLIKDRALLQDPGDVRFDGRVVDLTIEDVITYNREQVIQSYRQVYACEPKFGLAELTCSAQDRPDVRNPERARFRITIDPSSGENKMQVEETLWDEMRDAIRFGRLRKEIGQK